MKALIVYASLTGNTEGIVEILSEIFTELGIENKVAECSQIDATEFLNYDICIIGTYTWGREGELPDEMVPFYEDMLKLDLTNKIYGTIGSGEEAYGYLCKSADDFAELFEQRGAIRGAETLKIEAAAETEEDISAIREFAEGFLKSEVRN